jgi:4a-hydroxytetrahydrobiopterin dehydratase
MKIKLSQNQLDSIIRKTLNEMKNQPDDWFRSGPEWEWTDEDDKTVEKMAKDARDKRREERRKKHQEFLKLIEPINKKKDISEDEEKSDWKIVDKMLTKSFSFDEYEDVLDFVNKIGQIAIKQNHHPEMIVKHDEVIVKMFDHEQNKISDKCYKFTNAVDKMLISDKEDIDERSRSFAFTRKKRLYSTPEVLANPLRYKESERIKKGVKKD